MLTLWELMAKPVPIKENVETHITYEYVPGPIYENIS